MHTKKKKAWFFNLEGKKKTGRKIKPMYWGGLTKKGQPGNERRKKNLKSSGGQSYCRGEKKKTKNFKPPCNPGGANSQRGGEN